MARAAFVALSLIALLAPSAGAMYYTCAQAPVCVAPPTLLVAEVEEDGIHLTWKAPIGGGVDQYVVHRWSSEGAKEVFGAGGTVYVDRPDTAGVYTYVVTAVYGFYESIPSNPAAASWPHCQPLSVDPANGEQPMQFYSDCLRPLPGGTDRENLIGRGP